MNMLWLTTEGGKRGINPERRRLPLLLSDIRVVLGRKKPARMAALLSACFSAPLAASRQPACTSGWSAHAPLLRGEERETLLWGFAPSAGGSCGRRG